MGILGKNKPPSIRLRTAWGLVHTGEPRMKKEREDIKFSKLKPYQKNLVELMRDYDTTLVKFGDREVWALFLMIYLFEKIGISMLTIMSILRKLGIDPRKIKLAYLKREKAVELNYSIIFETIQLNPSKYGFTKEKIQEAI